MKLDLEGRPLDRRAFLRLGGAAAASTAASISGLFGADAPRSSRFLNAQASPASPSGSRPNVLFISCDDLRPEFGFLGNSVIQTPNIDRFASRATTFGRVYSQMSMCNPCRTSLLTGLRPDTTRIFDQDTHFRSVVPNTITLPQAFKNAGYETVAVGKIFHNTLPDPTSWSRPEAEIPLNFAYLNPETRARMDKRRERARAMGRTDGFINAYLRGPSTESFEAPDNLYEDGAIADAAINLLRELRGKQPFFLGVGFISPHLPFVSPKKYWDLYDRDTIPPAPNYYLPKAAPRFSLNRLTEFRCHEDLVLAPDPSEGLLPEPQARLLKHGYYASVSFLDAQIGRLLDGLTALGLRDKTTVVLLGDSGWKLGEHGGWGKLTNYEIDTRATLIISLPGLTPAAKIENRIVELLDLHPSMCELAGISPPPNLDGVSFAPLFRDAARPWKSAAFSQFPRGFSNRIMGRAMRTDRYRYIEWIDWYDDVLIETELYDHQTDPQENVNIAVDQANAALVRSLAAQMKAGPKAALPPK